MKLWIALIAFISGFAFSYEVCLDNPYSYIEQSQLKEAPLFLIEKFRFNGDESILNLDCARQDLTARLSRLLPHGQIVELISSSNLDQIAAHFPKKEYSNVHFTLGTISDLKHPHQYEIIFAFDTIQWSDHFVHDLKKMQYALKPAGAIGLSIPLNLPLTLVQTLEEFRQSEKWGNYFKDFLKSPTLSLKEVQELLLQTNFVINLIAERVQKNSFETKEEFFNFIEHWVEEFKLIPADKKSEFLDDLFNRYILLEGIDFLNHQKIDLSLAYLVVIAHKR